MWSGRIGSVGEQTHGQSNTTGYGKELETVRSVDGTEIVFERTGSGDPLVVVVVTAKEEVIYDDRL